MKDGTKMVSIASKLANVIGSDPKKYEDAMKERIEEEIPSDMEESDDQNKNDFMEVDDNFWDDWEVDEGKKKAMKSNDRKHMKDRERERTLQRRKQRERKITYFSSNDLPVYGYDEDWD